jgi:hypothetical protein
MVNADRIVHFSEKSIKTWSIGIIKKRVLKAG